MVSPTQSRPLTPGSAAPTDLLAAIAEGARQREQERTLPHDPIRRLREAGLGRLRLPTEDGGAGATLPDLFGFVIDLVAQDRLFGNAVSEQNALPVGPPAGAAPRLDSTGTLFSDLVNVQAVGPDGVTFRVTIPVDRRPKPSESSSTTTPSRRFSDVGVRADEIQRVAVGDPDAGPTYYGGLLRRLLSALPTGAHREHPRGDLSRRGGADPPPRAQLQPRQPGALRPRPALAQHRTVSSTTRRSSGPTAIGDHLVNGTPPA